MKPEHSGRISLGVITEKELKAGSQNLVYDFEAPRRGYDSASKKPHIKANGELSRYLSNKTR